MPDTDLAAPNYHVLLIGIDAYQGGVSLNGCVNDIDTIQRILMCRLGIRADQITRLAAPRSNTSHEDDVPEARPTLANIRGAFERLGSDRVMPGDRVFIYYSGHGTQCRVVDASGASFVREALLPADNIVLTRRQYLFDWELNTMLSRVATRTQAVTVVLDCCCSAGATRSAFDHDTSMTRFSPSPEPYLLARDQPPPPSGSMRGLADGITGGVSVCQVAAACLDDERARESGRDGGRSHGEMTRALAHQLEQVPRDELSELRWGKIWRRLVAEVAEVNRAQHPWLFGGYARRVFGGPPEDGDAGYSVTRHGDGYRLDVGSLSGVTEGARVAVYGGQPPMLPPIGSAEDEGSRVGLLRVTNATRTSSTAVAVEDPFELTDGSRGRLVSAGRDAKLRVGLSPADPELAATLGMSSLLEVAGEGEEGDVTLVKRADGAWAVTDDVFGAGDTEGEPTLAVIPANRLDGAYAVVEHYYNYSRPLRLAKACQDLPKALRVKLLDCEGAETIPADRAQTLEGLAEVPPGEFAPYELKAGQMLGGRAIRGDRICIAVYNDSQWDLRVTLVCCQQSGRVSVVSQKVVPTHGRHGFWQDDVLGRPFELWLPGEKTLGVDRLVVIGTTNRDASLWHLEVRETFDQFVEDRTRDLGGPRGDHVPEMWTSTVTAWRLES